MNPHRTAAAPTSIDSRRRSVPDKCRDFLARLSAYTVFLGPLTLACYWLKTGSGPYRWVSQGMLHRFGSEVPFVSWLLVLVGTFVVVLAFFSAVYWTGRLAVGNASGKSQFGVAHSAAPRGEMIVVSIYAMSVAVLTMCPVNADLRSVSISGAISLAGMSAAFVLISVVAWRVLRGAPLSQVALHGLLCMALAFCLSRRIGLASGAMAIFCAVAIGLLFLFTAGSALASMRGGMVALFLGFFLICAAGIFSVALAEHPLTGARFDQTAPISLAQVSQHNHELFYRFSDGYIATDYQRSIVVYGGSRGRQHPLYDLYAAPIVPENWHANDSVPAWAVTRAYKADDRRRWTEPFRAGVRVEIFPGLSSETEAIAKVENEFGLKSQPRAPIINWILDPQTEQDQMWFKLRTIAGVLSGIWLSAVVIAWTMTQLSRRQKNERP